MSFKIGNEPVLETMLVFMYLFLYEKFDWFTRSISLSHLTIFQLNLRYSMYFSQGCLRKRRVAYARLHREDLPFCQCLGERYLHRGRVHRLFLWVVLSSLLRKFTSRGSRCLQYRINHWNLSLVGNRRSQEEYIFKELPLAFDMSPWPFTPKLKFVQYNPSLPQTVERNWVTWGAVRTSILWIVIPVLQSSIIDFIRWNSCLWSLSEHLCG